MTDKYDIIPIELLIGALISEIDFSDIIGLNRSVSYSWGDSQDVNKWIAYTEESVNALNMFNHLNNVPLKNKYPLIWLVTPIRQEIVSLQEQKAMNMKFVICCPSKLETMNLTREKTGMLLLSKILSRFMESMDKSGYIVPYRYGHTPVYEFHKHYNFGLDKRSKNSEDLPTTEVIDNIDAIRVNIDLRFLKNCITNKITKLCL